jgi:hypothetical protein
VVRTSPAATGKWRPGPPAAATRRRRSRAGPAIPADTEDPRRPLSQQVLGLAAPRCAAVRAPYTTHNREVGGSNPPGAIALTWRPFGAYAPARRAVNFRLPEQCSTDSSTSPGDAAALQLSAHPDRGVLRRGDAEERAVGRDPDRPDRGVPGLIGERRTGKDRRTEQRDLRFEPAQLAPAAGDAQPLGARAAGRLRSSSSGERQRVVSARTGYFVVSRSISMLGTRRQRH